MIHPCRRSYETPVTLPSHIASERRRSSALEDLRGVADDAVWSMVTSKICRLPPSVGNSSISSAHSGSRGWIARATPLARRMSGFSAIEEHGLHFDEFDVGIQQAVHVAFLPPVGDTTDDNRVPPIRL